MFSIQPGSIDYWTWGLLGAGALVAVTSLVRLMRRRRDELLTELSAQARAAQQRQEAAAARDQKPKRKTA